MTIPFGISPFAVSGGNPGRSLNDLPVVTVLNDDDRLYVLQGLYDDASMTILQLKEEIGSPSSLTPGSILFGGSTGSVSQDNANLFWDDTNNRMGVGTNTPDVSYKVDVRGLIRGVGGVDSYGFGAGAIIRGFRAEGSISSPSASAAAGVARLLALAYDGATYQNCADITLSASAIPTSSSAPGNISFRVTPVGSLSAVERMTIDSAGNVGVGGTNVNVRMRVAGNISGGISSTAILANGVVQSDVTNSVNYFQTGLTTVAASFVCPTARHYLASQGTIGAGSSITSQRGFEVSNSLTGGTSSNYGVIIGDIGGAAAITSKTQIGIITQLSAASGGGLAFNIYASGTAPNAFAGNVRIGSVTAPTVALDVTGDAKVSGNESINATAVSGSTTRLWVGGDLTLGGADITNYFFNGYFGTSSFRPYATGFMAAIQFTASTGRMGISTAPTSVAANGSSTITERMTFLPSGAVGMNKTDPTYHLDINSPSPLPPMRIQQPTQYGGIAIRNNFASGSNSGINYLQHQNELGTVNASIYTRMGVDGSTDFLFQTTPAGARNTDRSVDSLVIQRLFTYPGADNVASLGAGGFRWTQLYAATSTINTSDARAKDWRGGLSQEELYAAKDLAKEIGVYRWKDAVAGKGDQARMHVGVIAQKVQEIMARHGLNAEHYGFFCYDIWEERTVNPTRAPNPENPDDLPEPEIIPAGDLYGVRYDELTLFIIAGQEQRLAALEEAFA